jgi:hypothetical protein
VDAQAIANLNDIRWWTNRQGYSYLTFSSLFTFFISTATQDSRQEQWSRSVKTGGVEVSRLTAQLQRRDDKAVGDKAFDNKAKLATGNNKCNCCRVRNNRSGN